MDLKVSKIRPERRQNYRTLVLAKGACIIGGATGRLSPHEHVVSIFPFLTCWCLCPCLDFAFAFVPVLPLPLAGGDCHEVLPTEAKAKTKAKAEARPNAKAPI